MSQIRAFVGHSFNDVDEPVVRAFLNYLDGIGTALPGFSWKHAERPEPKIVADKVLELLSDRNVFIGICTKREAVIESSALKKQLLGNAYTIKASDIRWKASDWVIQEIGLAIGKGLKIVLLLESGVRVPGELQGNLEYIPFERNSPERAFQKLLLMLSSLATEVSTAPEAIPIAAESEPVDEDPGDNVKTTGLIKPDAAWTQTQYELAALRAIALEKRDEYRRIDEAYRASSLYREGENAACWDAYCEYAKLRYGAGGDISRLKAFSAKNPASARIMNYVSVILETYEEFGEAIAWAQRAAEVSAAALDKLRYLRRVAKLSAISGQTESAQVVIGKMKAIRQLGSESGEVVLRAELDIAQQAKDDEAEIALMERLLEINPTDQNIRFSLAYKYSEMGRNELSLLHYSRIPTSDRSGGAWNNYGVSLDRLGMPAKSVDAYRRAEELGETLAMSNIANKQISVGLLKEAAETCDAAVRVPEHHKNVDVSYGRLKEIPEEETKKEALALDKAKSLSSIYREVGRRAVEEVPNLSTEWQGPDCTLVVSQVGNKVQLQGAYQKEGSSLAGLMMTGSTGPSQMRNYKVEYSGKMLGKALIGSVSRRLDTTGERTLLGDFGLTPNRVIMLLESDNSAKVYEFTAEESYKEYELKSL